MQRYRQISDIDIKATRIIISNTMDQFDDLPDILDNDSKPKFMTEVSTNGPSGTVSNGLEPLFEDEVATTQKADNDLNAKNDLNP